MCKEMCEVWCGSETYIMIIGTADPKAPFRINAEIWQCRGRLLHVGMVSSRGISLLDSGIYGKH